MTNNKKAPHNDQKGNISDGAMSKTSALLPLHPHPSPPHPTHVLALQRSVPLRAEWLAAVACRHFQLVSLSRSDMRHRWPSICANYIHSLRVFEDGQKDFLQTNRPRGQCRTQKKTQLSGNENDVLILNWKEWKVQGLRAWMFLLLAKEWTKENNWMDLKTWIQSFRIQSFSSLF